MKIQEKVAELLKYRAKLDVMKKEMLPIQEKRDALQDDIIKHMKKMEFNSVKTTEAVVSIVKSNRLSIKNEAELVADLKNRGLTDMVKEGINTALWSPFARQAIKEGRNLPGTEVLESEYISVRKVKPKKNGGGQNG